jgi:FAD/FMN-containing dehydrogenase
MAHTLDPSSRENRDGVATSTTGLSRRGFLAGIAGTAALTGLGWTPAFAAAAGSPQSTLPTPPNFPAATPLYQQAYANWSDEIRLDAVWTCAPKTAAEVVAIVNWAHTAGYKIRPRGAMHGWTPLTVVVGAPVTQVVLLDTMQYLNTISVDPSGTPATVTAGPGATLLDILGAMQNKGLGWVSVPAPGNITIAGALAVDAHGAAIPAAGEQPITGTTYGSLSNLVTALTAVVWDNSAQRYALKTFTRSNPQIKPLLTHLGRTFITSVTMQAGANYRLRCQSNTTIDVSELFAPAGSTGRTFDSYLKASGRVETIWFPFTTTPWLKVWTPTPKKPLFSREVTGPYNYTFSDNISEETSAFVCKTQLSDVSATPFFGSSQLQVVSSGLVLTGSWDIWGWSKDLQFYIKPTTLRLTEGGGAVITSRANVQRVIHEFTTWYSGRMSYYRQQNKFPINGPVEIRCCGLDQASEVKVPSAGSPTISSMRPRPDHPDWDTAIWLNVLCIPNTPGMWAFYREMEQWMTANFSGAYATFRPEWSKGWAFTAEGPYKDPDAIRTAIPDRYRAGLPTGDNWDSALATYNTLDPARIFSNTFMDQILP